MCTYKVCLEQKKSKKGEKQLKKKKMSFSQPRKFAVYCIGGSPNTVRRCVKDSIP